MDERIFYYCSPIGVIKITADAIGLTGLQFVRRMDHESELEQNCTRNTSKHIQDTVTWLDSYFSGGKPLKVPSLHLRGTPFQMTVWSMLSEIPHGSTVTYGQIAERIASEQGMPRMSAQAVGGAVGRNPIAVIVPCHRVLGRNGSLTGYAAGLTIKRALLTIEEIPYK